MTPLIPSDPSLILHNDRLRLACSRADQAYEFMQGIESELQKFSTTLDHGFNKIVNMINELKEDNSRFYQSLLSQQQLFFDEMLHNQQQFIQRTEQSLINDHHLIPPSTATTPSSNP